MARGPGGLPGASPSVGYLLNKSGDMPSSLPMPFRPGDPMPAGAQWHGGVNVTDYQKQLFLSLQQSIPVIQPTAFQRLVVIGFTFTVAGSAGDVLAITAPPEIRAFLAIRNDPASGGAIWIAMDTIASQTTAAFALNPGGLMFLDTFVPQNDIHIAAVTASVATPTVAVISYANARFRATAQ